MRRKFAEDQQQAGFSLLELMITLAVLAILVAIAFPSFRGVLQSNYVSTQANQMVAGLTLARSESIRRASGTGVCASANGTACGADWGAGWLVWDDQDGDGSVDTGETVVRYEQGGNGKLTWAGPATAIEFDSRGRSANAVIQAISLQPSTCTAGSSNLRRTLSISATGAVQMTTVACQ